MFGERWNKNKIADQSSRVVVITGANSGIGFHTALALAEKDAKVILAVRNPEKGQQAQQQILAQYPDAQISVESLDLASLGSIKAFAARFNAAEQRLDLLINNAGIMFPPLSRTEDGFELQFGTNHLGHFALTALLFDRVASTVNSRIVNVASLAHRGGKLDYADLNWNHRKYNKYQAYSDSKLANLYFTYELARRLEEREYLTLATAAHPGYTVTNLQNNMPMHWIMNPIFGQKAAKGALPTLRAAIDPDTDYGDYYGPNGMMEMGGYPRKVKSNDLAKNEENAIRLWEISEELTGVEYPLA